ncbi:hypothetical protein N7492_010310 [Penicillium capsulatum]|uniref:Uncharacterized protein n=1 Tax=Penicillium capsulatum TaxID=69766 RepID=A0A9W9LFB7_9EURO|nr:hypothetical protein N7492_010310 [Penicillium capsulatum]
MHFRSLLLLLGAPAVLAKCKCTPTDDCWPSVSKWTSLSNTVDGHLIANEPLAKPCYDGLGKDPKECQKISKVYKESSFQGSVSNWICIYRS